MIDTTESRLLLDTLARFEQQIDTCKTHAELVELFCRQVIDFLQKHLTLQPLVAHWRIEYERLLTQSNAYQERALSEIKDAFQKIITASQVESAEVTRKIAQIQWMFSGEPGEMGFSSWPLCRTMFGEVKELLQKLFDLGEHDLCAQYATIETAFGHPVIGDGGYCPAYIREFTFSPTLELVAGVEQELQWDQLQNPVMVWRYFESALWCWHTEATYFEGLVDIFGRKSNVLLALGEKETWLEITAVKNRYDTARSPIVFTTRLFKDGFCTLCNAVITFVSNGGQVEAHPINEAMQFELRLEENHLWMLVNTGIGNVQPFHLKRFNEGVETESAPYIFVQQLFDHPEGDDIECDSDNIPKLILRSGFGELIRDYFFGKSRGTKVRFKGTKVSIRRDEKCRRALEVLIENHQRVGSPEYHRVDWS